MVPKPRFGERGIQAWKTVIQTPSHLSSVLNVLGQYCTEGTKYAWVSLYVGIGRYASAHLSYA